MCGVNQSDLRLIVLYSVCIQFSPSWLKEKNRYLLNWNECGVYLLFVRQNHDECNILFYISIRHYNPFIHIAQLASHSFMWLWIKNVQYCYVWTVIRYIFFIFKYYVFGMHTHFLIIYFIVISSLSVLEFPLWKKTVDFCCLFALSMDK
jgi:hypothetical protein